LAIDLNKQICCQGNAYSLANYIQPNCCGSTAFDRRYSICCGSIVYNSTISGCCNGVRYRLSYQKCCNETISNYTISSSC
jgi:hypothetical protein